MSTTVNWVKLVFNETPEKAIVKQGYLFDEGEFFRVVGDNSETLIRKVKVISITKKNNELSNYSSLSIKRYASSKNHSNNILKTRKKVVQK